MCAEDRKSEVSSRVAGGSETARGSRGTGEWESARGIKGAVKVRAVGRWCECGAEVTNTKL